jgi:hypothetical protein
LLRIGRRTAAPPGPVDPVRLGVPHIPRKEGR